MSERESYMHKILWRCVLGLTTTIFCSPSVLGEDSLLRTEKPIEAFCYGQILDEDGQAVQGAKVTLSQNFSRAFDASFIPLLEKSPTVTVHAKDGVFRFELNVDDPEFWPGLGDFLLITQAPGYCTSVRKCTTDRLLVDLPLEVQLRSCEGTSLQILTADGQPLPDAEVRVSRVEGIRIPDTLTDLDSVVANAEGQVTLDAFDNANLQEVIVRSSAIGIQRTPVVTIAEGLQAQLKPTGSIQGQLLIDGQPAPASLNGTRLWLASQDKEEYVRGGAAAMSWCEAQLNAQGEFQCNGMVFGQVLFRLPAADDFPFIPTLKTRIDASRLVADKEPLQLTLHFESARKVTFRFTGREAKPLPNLGVHATFQRMPKRTNDQGAVDYWFAKEATLDGQIFAWDPFYRYIQPAFGFSPVKQKLDSEGVPEPVSIPEAYSVSGRVLDSKGKPVSGATVTGAFGLERFTENRSTLSNRHGDFQLRGLPASTSVTVSARKGHWMTDLEEPKQIQSGTQEVDLVVQPQATARLTGTVVDVRGQAIAGAKVQLARGISSIKEGYGAEEISAQPLEGDSATTTSDENGNFASQPIVNFADRFQVSIEASGYLPLQSHFLSGKARLHDSGHVDLGQFRLFAKPNRKNRLIKVVDDQDRAIAGAEIVCVGPTVGRVLATTDASGEVSLDILDGPQWLAVKMPGYQLHLEFLASLDKTYVVKLGTRRDAPNVEQPGFVLNADELRNLAKQILLEVPQPGESDSTVYRQMRYFSALPTADFEAFQKVVLTTNSPYEHAGQFALMSANQVFQKAPMQALEALRKQAPTAQLRASVLAGVALSTREAEVREEILGEAALEVGNCSGSEKLMAAGQVALALALSSRLDAAEAVLREAWEDNTEMQEMLRQHTRKHDRVVARTFAPKMVWLNPQSAFELIPLLADQREVPRLTAEALVYLSMKDQEAAFRLKKEMQVDLDAGVEAVFRLGDGALLHDAVHQDWLVALAEELRPSAAKVKLLIAASKHMPPGKARSEKIQQAAQAWRDAKVDFWYYWSDPGKGALEALAGYHDLHPGELDELIFASLAVGPSEFGSYNPLCVLANSARLVALRDRQLAEAMLTEILRHHQWMRVNGRLKLDGNFVFSSIAWSRPYWALEMLQNVESRLEKDDNVIPLQLRTALVNEIQTLINIRCQ